ncbi:MAG: DEAD/DEAH box helicase family protein [Anaerolineae bacterium]|nr:DEAD/DEAH box helicase family protein [Anaerolineae bacterium]
MFTTPEAKARQEIDRLLTAAGWIVQNRDEMYLDAGLGVAVREFQLSTGPADYLLFVAGVIVGVIEAKKASVTLSGFETQSIRYSDRLPKNLPAPRRPLPFLYQSTGEETWFTNGFDPTPRSRRVFAFHRPETLADWMAEGERNLRWRLGQYPALLTDGLWRAQIEAIQNLERSMAEGRPRALIQMATGSGKTYTAVSYIYRMLQHGRANRVLFLVDRNNLARQTLREFENYTTPDDGRKFTAIYNVQHLTSNQIDGVSKVVITTIQRLYSMLRGEPELDPVLEEGSLFEQEPRREQPSMDVSYNPALPIEFFDVIITDECHRSIYHLWKQALDYFDAFLIGMTATPGKQTFGFFNENLVMEYTREQAVIDGVNVPGEVYVIRTQVTAAGSRIEAGYHIPKRDRKTRKLRMELLDEDFVYGANQLDQQVMTPSQIRTIIRTFRDKLFTEMFPERNGDHVPKTLIFAKDDSHAEDIVRIVRDEFNQDNTFCQKITYRVDGKPEELISSFRNDYKFRIAVTVDMIATGTDIKPVEVLLFMRLVKSAGLYEQMQGRGVRVIDRTDLTNVTPDAGEKTRFLMVDAVGVVEQEKAETITLERKRTVAFGKLLDDLAAGDTTDDTLLTLAGRLARLAKHLSENDRAEIRAASGGRGLTEIAHQLREAADPDAAEARAAQAGQAEPTDDQIAAAAAALKRDVLRLLTPPLRKTLKSIQARDEMVIDEVSRDQVLFAGFTDRSGAESAVQSFRAFIEQHRDEITALRILYAIPHQRQRLEWQHITELAEKLKQPPTALTPDKIWAAFAAVEPGRVRAAGTKRLLTDLIALVRHVLEPDPEGALIPYPEQVRARYQAWLATQEAAGRGFSPAQREWLDAIAGHIGVNLTMEMQDFNDGDFFRQGGVTRALELFGDMGRLRALVEDLNTALAA